MFKRKLAALQFHNANAFDASDENQFRNLIVWLEDQKIRHYKIEERDALRDTNSTQWLDAYAKYHTDLSNPVPISDRNAALDWFLGFAVKLDYGDNVEKYERKPGTGAKAEGTSKTTTSSPLESLDFESQDFKVGVKSLATLLKIPLHPDHLVLLKAISIVIKERLILPTQKAETKARGRKTSSVSIPLSDVNLGFSTPDAGTAEAAKILRLLHVHDLRELQDAVNRAIVSVQKITANPKTDTKLGKVGR